MEKLNAFSGLTLLIILIGLGFSGTLAAFSIFTDTCPLGGGCPEFLGYPACIYGLVMYIILLATFALALKGRISERPGLKILVTVSLVGMLFAGSLLVQEYMLDRPLSVCAAGFAMYLLIFLLTLARWKGK